MGIQLKTWESLKTQIILCCHGQRVDWYRGEGEMFAVQGGHSFVLFENGGTEAAISVFKDRQDVQSDHHVLKVNATFRVRIPMRSDGEGKSRNEFIMEYPPEGRRATIGDSRSVAQHDIARTVEDIVQKTLRDPCAAS